MRARPRLPAPAVSAASSALLFAGQAATPSQALNRLDVRASRILILSTDRLAPSPPVAIDDLRRPLELALNDAEAPLEQDPDIHIRRLDADHSR
jgi:hypothetical protein